MKNPENFPSAEENNSKEYKTGQAQRAKFEVGQAFNDGNIADEIRRLGGEVSNEIDRRISHAQSYFQIKKMPENLSIDDLHRIEIAIKDNLEDVFKTQIEEQINQFKKDAENTPETKESNKEGKITAINKGPVYSMGGGTPYIATIKYGDGTIGYRYHYNPWVKIKVGDIVSRDDKGDFKEFSDEPSILGGNVKDTEHPFD